MTVGSHYDAAGNQDQQGGYTYAYDAENRLKSSAIGAGTTTYSYDGEGRRVMKVSGGGSEPTDCGLGQETGTTENSLRARFSSSHDRSLCCEPAV